ncbi:MAG: hypothetical protein Q8J89_05105 [Caulobacter sp.]|nr:hypothetical protein [Caulobacter sp.]
MMRELFRFLDPRGWAVVAGGVLLLVALLFVLGRCSRGDEVRAARDATAMGEARTTSAVEAINEIGRLEDRGQATDKEVSDAQDAIRNAAPTDRDRVARARLRCLQHGECNGL